MTRVFSGIIFLARFRAMPARLLPLIICAAVGTACTGDGAGGQPDSLLVGEEWIVEDLDNKGIVDMSRATMLFDSGGGLSGRGTCNRYNSSYNLTGERLSVGNIAATRMACPPALMNQETMFFNILGQAQRFDIAKDGALVISANTGETITARR